MQSIKKFYDLLTGNGDLDDPKEKRQDDNFVDPDSTKSSLESNEAVDQTEHKSFKTSLRDALQEWSNDDARDIEEDDSTPMRSGL